MTFTPGTVPPADDITTAWWDATREHRYVVQQCTACGHVQHPPRALCTACYSMDHLGLSAASGEASIDSFTVIHRGPRPDIEVPYVIARVRLEEGPIVITRLIGDREWTIGDRVAVGWVDLDDGRALPVFGASVGAL